MPIPKPRDNEEEDDFISRCMSAIADEYDDNDQALAICGTTWREREKSMDNVERKAVSLQLNDDKEGTFVARIATLNVIDKDGDVTLPGAFPKGKEILISSYMHGSWQGSPPVGKAVIHEEGEEVLGKGEFNLKTASGLEHYEAVKFSGKLQEWSYGFKVLAEGSDKELEAWAKDHDGVRPVRIIKKVNPFEISPVLLGAGVDTATLAIKSGKTYADHTEMVLAAINELVAHCKSALAAVNEWDNRTGEIVDLRRKEGRVLSAKTKENIKRVLEAIETLSGVATDLKELLDATEPVDDEKLAQAILIFTKIRRELMEVI